MTDQGKVHRIEETFGKCMTPLMHDKTITDGAVRLYCHMHWRFGQGDTKGNWEGQPSMASYMDVDENTIGSRVRELEAKDWVVVGIRYNPDNGNWTTPYYHVFEDQQMARIFRQTYQPEPGEKIREKPDPEKVKSRKSRKGIGGNPDLIARARSNSSSDGSRPNSNWAGLPNSSSDGPPNSSCENLDSGDLDSIDLDIKDSPVGAGICFFKFEEISSKWDKGSKIWADPDIVYIGKGSGGRKLAGSIWANPCKTDDPAEALRLYRLHVLTTPELVAALPELVGKVLVWADEPNHAPVLLELVEAQLNGALPALVDEATATVLREQKTVRNNPNRQRIIAAVARHIFKIADPTRMPEGDKSIIGAFEKSIYNIFISQFGVCNYDLAERSVLRYVEWMKTNNRGLPRYVSGFDPDYISFMQSKDREIRTLLEREGTPATTEALSATTKPPQSRPQTLEEATEGLRYGSPMYKKAKAEWEASQKGIAQ
jgi:hypothetical protein